jgi:glycine cleavage system aminomethyltransferase T
MSALDFLSPARAEPSGDFHPLARSPMDRRQRDAGATFVERDGWLVPVSFPGEAEHLAHVGIADLSHLGKIEVRGPGGPVAGEDVHWYRISPRRALVLCPTAATVAWHERLASEFELALDVTAQHGILVIAGPERDTVVRRMSHLHDFPCSGEVAHVNTIHALEVDGAVWMVFPQEFGHYLWEVAVDRAEPLGGGPVGVDALKGGTA